MLRQTLSKTVIRRRLRSPQDDKDERNSVDSATSSSSSGTDECSTPLRQFAEGVEKNSWSEPPATNFHVRGLNYLDDDKKTISAPFLFPLRGAELFLTTECPENVGRCNAILDGKLRTTPTFVVNFRFPWGLLILSFEIPQKFLPFLHARYSSTSGASRDDLERDLSKLSPSERAACRFLMNDDIHKQTTFKLIPMVVEGPWVVRNVVAGKPVIIGNKLPVKYFYEPLDKAKGIAEYLELDLDIGNSSAKAKKIVSVCQKYMNSITVDIGFVIQGNTQDELPEQMLGSARLHKLNGRTAPIFPPM